MAEKSNAARDSIRAALNDKFTEEQIKFLIDEVLAITKKGRADITCRHCQRRQIVDFEIPDARAVTSAIVDLSNQAFGRPTEVQPEEQQFIVNRHVYVVGETEEDGGTSE